MHLFYSSTFQENYPYLPEDESRHCVKVLRMTVGDSLRVTDGKGNLYTAAVSVPDAKKCQLQIINIATQVGKRDYSVHIAIAPTKNADRTEWMVEKCVEIGVDEISFLACERSERKHFKTDRLEKIAVSAMKQSLKAYLPAMHELIPFRDFVSQVHSGQKFIAHLEEEKRDLLVQIAAKNKAYCILIGPEGDFSPGEIRLALDNGFLPVSLGESRLRTETAGIVSCHILNLVNSL